MITKKCNLIVLCRKFTSYIPRASSKLSVLPSLDLPQLLDVMGKRLKFHLNARQGFKKVLNGLVDLSCYPVTVTSFFCFSITRFLSRIWLFYLKQIKSLEDAPAPICKKWEEYRLIRISTFSYHLKWGDFYHYEWKFRIQKVELNVYSAENRAKFLFQSE